VISTIANEDTYLPYLQSAGIPDLNSGTLPSQWTSPVSYDMNALSIDVSGGYAALLHLAGCTSMVDVYDTVGSSAATQKALSQGIAATAQLFKMKYLGQVVVPSNAPDPSAYLSEAVSKGAQCLAVLAVGAQLVSALQALVPLANENKFQKVVFCTACAAIPGSTAAEAPYIAKLGDKLVLLGAADSPDQTSNPAVNLWVKDQTTYGPNPPDLEAVSGTNWEWLQLVVQAAEATYPNVTAASVKGYLDKLHDWWPGLQPPVSFDKAPANPFGPRVFGAWVANYKFENGGKLFRRISPYISVLTGEINNNPIPAGGYKPAN
jgi:hypothetical protein